MQRQQFLKRRWFLDPGHVPAFWEIPLDQVAQGLPIRAECEAHRVWITVQLGRAVRVADHSGLRSFGQHFRRFLCSICNAISDPVK